ncbi:MAG: hypothetical protein V7637_4154 [Mycobacteriales bacterium]
MIKSKSPQPLGNFEELLLAELSAVVTQRAADLGTDPVPGGAAQAPARRRSRRRLVLAPAAAGAVVAGVVLGVMRIGGGAAAAYAVDKQPDGSVLVTVRDTSRLDGLPQRLADVGLPARVVPITTSCPPVRLNPITSSMSVAIDPVLNAKPGTTVRVRFHGTVPPGQFLVFGLATSEAIRNAHGWIVAVDGGFTAHPPACLPVRKFPLVKVSGSLPGSAGDDRSPAPETSGPTG